MQSSESVQRVRIYITREDQWQGEPRYQALLDRLRTIGATGATAIQGLAGFGPGSRAGLGGQTGGARHPVIVEWVERAERVARLLPALEELIGDALVTVEPVPVYQARLRSRGPFAAERSAGDLMSPLAELVSADAPLAEALALMVERGLLYLPVVDAEGRLAGLLGAQDLRWRAGLGLPPALLPRLDPAERDQLLAPLIGRSVAQVMSAEPRSLSSLTPIAQAVVTMVEWGYRSLPVIDRDGRPIGALGEGDVLRAALEQAAARDETGVRDADPPASVALVMQSAAPRVGLGQSLAAALPPLFTHPEQPLLALDPQGRLVGSLGLAEALDALEPAGRAALLAALGRAEPPAGLPGADRPLDQLVGPAPPTIAPEASVLDAARRLIELDVERLAVTDETGRFLGIIARGGLVRALMQQND